MPHPMHGESPLTLTVRAVAIATALFLGTCSSAYGQQPGPPISTSRLGLTKAPGVLAASVVQVEAGYTHGELGERTRHSIGETLLRVGLGRQVELRAGIPSYLRTTTPADTVSGLSDALIAVRRRFTEASGWRPMLAVQAGTTLPLGADAVTAGRLQPELAGYALWRLPEAVQLLAMGVHRQAVASGDRYGQSTVSAGIRRELVTGLSAQADYGIVHSTRSGALDAHQVRLAAAVRIGREVQLDAYAGSITAGGRHESLLGLGISTRW
jgi:hypothetical protein